MGSIEAGPQRELFLADEAETVRCGAQLARAVSGGAIIFLLGELGVGKTTFTRGVLLGCGHRGAVKSPTYTLVEPYETPPVSYTISTCTDSVIPRSWNISASVTTLTVTRSV